MEVTAIILAGGESSRMKTNKALLQWQNKTIIEHLLETLQPIANQVLISDNTNRYEFLKIPIIPDIFPATGPAAGIFSTLKHSKTEINFFTSVDTPFLSQELIFYLLKNSEGFEATIPLHQHFLEPLIAVYKKSALPVFEKCIENKIFSMQKIVEKLNCNKILISQELNFYHSDLFLNLNTFSDYEKAQKINLQKNLKV